MQADPTIQLVRRSRLEEIRAQDPPHYTDIFDLDLRDLETDKPAHTVAASVLAHNDRLVERGGRAALLAIIEEQGLSRDDAYRIVQRHAMRAWDEGTDFRKLLEADDAQDLLGYRDGTSVTDETIEAFAGALIALYEGRETYEQETPALTQADGRVVQFGAPIRQQHGDKVVAA